MMTPVLAQAISDSDNQIQILAEINNCKAAKEKETLEQVLRETLIVKKSTDKCPVS